MYLISLELSNNSYCSLQCVQGFAAPILWIGLIIQEPNVILSTVKGFFKEIITSEVWPCIVWVWGIQETPGTVYFDHIRNHGQTQHDNHQVEIEEQ